MKEMKKTERFTDKEWEELASLLSDEKSEKAYLLDRFMADDKNNTGKQWKELNKNKAQTLENFIKRYGDDKALFEYKKYLKKRRCFPASKSSQLFFSILDKYLSNKYTTYFYQKNGKDSKG